MFSFGSGINDFSWAKSDSGLSICAERDFFDLFLYLSNCNWMPVSNLPAGCTMSISVSSQGKANPYLPRMVSAEEADT